MGVIFDILGSFVVRAAIVAVMLNLMLSLHEQLQKKNEQAYMNEVMAAPALTIVSDLKLAGYNSSSSNDSTKMFPVASANEMQFFADTDENGSSELIRYYVNNGILYRTVNGANALELARSVTAFQLTYYFASGFATAPGINVWGIKSIDVRLQMQSASLGVTSRFSGVSDSTLYTVEWREHVFPKNL